MRIISAGSGVIWMCPGIADRPWFCGFVYIPKPEYKADYPALVVELKWNKTADTALQQIKDRKYPQSLEPYTGNILLVGINYDKKTKEHSCVIENDKKQ